MIRLLFTAFLLLSFASGGAWAFEERVVLAAGGGEGPDGSPALQAKLTSPFGIGFDPDGSLIFVEMTTNRLRNIDRQGLIQTLSGDGSKGNSGDGELAVDAKLNGVHGLAVSVHGDIYIADTWNNRVRRIDAKTRRITAFAGTGKKGFSGDGGPATAAEFGGVYALALDEAGGKLYLADLDNRRIRVVDLASGLVSTAAGNGEKGVPTDGALAASSPLIDPRAVAVDGRKNVYILERSGHALRVVDKDGKIRTVVGDGSAGNTGDGVSGLKARLNGPKHLCVDSKERVIIADTENHRIRIFDPADGTIRALVGSGAKGQKGLGGPALSVELNQPHGVAIGPNGLLYIADSSNNRIVMIERENQ